MCTHRIIRWIVRVKKAGPPRQKTDPWGGGYPTRIEGVPQNYFPFFHEELANGKFK